MEIEILNWDKYNTRKDIKNPSWFAVSNRMIEDSDIFELTDKEFRAWVYCLSRGSIQNDEGLAKIDVRHSLRVSGIDEDAIVSMLHKMEKHGAVRVRTEPVRMRTDGVQAHESRVHYITDITNKQTIKASVIDENFKSDFTHEYLKQVGIKTQKAWFQAYPDTEFVLEEINKASIYLTNNPGKYTRFGTFFSGWLSRAWEKVRDAKKEVHAKKSEQQMAVGELERLAEQALADYKQTQEVQNA